MQLELSDDDREIIDDLMGNGVLVDVEPHRIDAPNGFMAIVCSDCDQFAHKYQFLSNVCRVRCPDDRIHIFALNGGGTLLSPHSPTRVGDEHIIISKHVAGAMKMKGLSTLVSKCHAPCGAAYAHEMNFYECLKQTFAGKRFIKAETPGLHVACFAPIDFGVNYKKYGKPTRKIVTAVTMHEWEKYAERKNLI
jgi:hypothetical protein